MKNHRWQWFNWRRKNIWKTIDTNGWNVKNHRQQWFTCKKTIEKPSTPMVPWQKPWTIPSSPKINHRYGLSISYHVNPNLNWGSLCKSCDVFNQRQDCSLRALSPAQGKTEFFDNSSSKLCGTSFVPSLKIFYGETTDCWNHQIFQALRDCSLTRDISILKMWFFWDF